STVTSTIAWMRPSMPRTPQSPWRIDVGDLRGDGPVGKADATRREAVVAHAVWPVPLHVACHDAVLPLDKAGRVGDVVEHLQLWAGDVDARRDRRHHFSSANSSAKRRRYRGQPSSPPTPSRTPSQPSP